MQLPPVSEVRNDDAHMIEKTFLWSQPSIYFESVFVKDTVTELYDEFSDFSNPNYQKAVQSNLNITHRFGDNLAKVLDEFVYKFGFHSAAKNPTEIIAIHSNSNPLDANERSNEFEAKIIKQLVEEYDIDKFAVLTPYKKQVRLLKNTLGRQYYQNIFTIHKSQGSEWDTIIFSVVDDCTSGKRGMFFTDSQKKKFHSLNLLNTVVSRATKSCIG
jgi:hypothetical protein